MIGIFSDLRHAARTLRRTPGYTAVALATLTVAIGGTVAIFSTVKSVVLDPLQYREPERVVGFWAQGDWSEAEYEFVRERATSYQHLAAFNPGVRRTLTGVGDPQLIDAVEVTQDFFSVLGIGTMLGRSFTGEEAQPGIAKAVMLSGGLWKREFGADPAVLGTTITLDGDPYTVVGVMPETFVYPSADVRMWTLRHLDPSVPYYRSFHGYRVIGRLAHGVTHAQARAEAAALGGGLEEVFEYHPQFSKANGATVVPLRQQVVGDSGRPLFVLFGAVGFVLLIACTNIAGLQLNRLMNRRREITVRSALGASRWRIVRQLLAESALLGVTGGALGTALAVGSLESVVTALPPETARLGEIGVDGLVLTFAVGISLLCSVSFGLLPAWQTSKADMQRGLKEDTRTAAGDAAKSRLRRSLVVAQTALAVVLLTAAGLMGRSLWRLLRVDAGFEVENVLTLRVVPPADYGAESRSQFLAEVTERIAALPSVRAVGAVQLLPIRTGWVLGFSAEGAPAGIAREHPAAFWRSVTPGYFDALGTPMVAGRDFARSDRAGTRPVAIVNETLARRYWPGEDALGKRVQISLYEGWLTVVGIAGDAKVTGLPDDIPPVVFQPYAQHPRASAMSLAVRTAGDPLELAPTVRDQIHAVEARTPIAEVQTLEQIVSRSIGQSRSLAIFLVALAATSLLLGAMGLFGLISFGVSQRTREFGVRVALGAKTTDVLRQVLGEGLGLTALGLVIGFALSLVLGRLVASVLFDTTPGDPLTLVGVAMLMLLTAILASAVPAVRASRVQPSEALRAE